VLWNLDGLIRFLTAPGHNSYKLYYRDFSILSKATSARGAKNVTGAALLHSPEIHLLSRREPGGLSHSRRGLSWQAPAVESPPDGVGGVALEVLTHGLRPEGSLLESSLLTEASNVEPARH
jgi:hypothetical protein